MVLVAAGDLALRRLVSGALESDGFTTTSAPDSAAAADALADVHPAAVVVHAAVAETEPGRELCRRAGDEAIPVLLLGRRRGPVGVIDALDRGGADDDLAPPFHPLELCARVRALVRRRGVRIAAVGIRRIGRATVDLDHREVWLGPRKCRLARSDWAILARLLTDEGVPVAYDQLLSTAFGSPYRDDLTRLRAAVRRIRRALGAGPGEAGPVRAVRGIGYAIRT